MITKNKASRKFKISKWQQKKVHMHNSNNFYAEDAKKYGKQTSANGWNLRCAVHYDCCMCPIWWPYHWINLCYQKPLHWIDDPWHTRWRNRRQTILSLGRTLWSSHWSPSFVTCMAAKRHLNLLYFSRAIFEYYFAVKSRIIETYHWVPYRAAARLNVRC